MEFNWQGFRDRFPRWFVILVWLKQIRTKVALVLVSLRVIDQVYFRERPLDWVEPNGWMVLGLALILAGLAFRLAALAVLRKKDHIATTGIYSLCRNPLYFGSILLTYGFCVLLNDDANYLYATLYFAVFYPLTIAWEEIRLTEQYGDAYRRYCSTTPRMLPLGRFQRNGFEWRKALRGGGLVLIVVVLASLAGVEVMAETIGR